MNELIEYHVQLPLIGHPDGWFTAGRALTPEGAGEIVRILLLYRSSEVSQIRIDVRIGHAGA